MIDPKELQDLFASLAAQIAKLPPGPNNGAGPRIVYHGSPLVVPLYDDPDRPGHIFAPDMVSASMGRLELHQALTLRDGALGGSANVRPLGNSAGNLGSLLALLGGGSPLVGAVGGLTSKPVGQHTIDEILALFKR